MAQKLYPDRIRLPFEFDAEETLREIEAMALHPYIYYSPIIMTIPPPGTKPGPEDPPATSKYIRKIIDHFREHTTVTLARLLRLEAGAEVRQHCDPMLGLEVEGNEVIRLTIPISGQDGVIFYLNDEPVPMKHGECWYMRLSDQHRIVHQGPKERINFAIDVKANDWMKNVIAEAMA